MGRVERELTDQASGGGVDDSDVHVLDEHLSQHWDQRRADMRAETRQLVTTISKERTAVAVAK